MRPELPTTCYAEVVEITSLVSGLVIGNSHKLATASVESQFSLGTVTPTRSRRPRA